MKGLESMHAKLFAIAAITILLARPAIAADPAPPDAPKTVPVEMSLLDLQIAMITVSNAGAACDNAKIYCQVIGARDGTMAKLQAAYAAIQAPAKPPGKKP